MSLASTIAQLVARGFPESTARKIATGELPMDEVSRMARAREQGFDVGNPVYHGTSTDFNQFDPSMSPNSQFWSTTDRAAIESGDVGAAGSGVIKDLYQRIKNPAGWDEYDELFTDQMIESGYDGIALREGNETTFVAFSPEQYRSVNAAFDSDEVNNPNLMASPAPVGAVGGLLATEAMTPEGQLNPLLAVPAEVGSALNEAIVGTLDFIGPDTINAVSELAGSEFRVPRLSDQELVRRYTQGGYMQQGAPRNVVRTATGLLSPL